MEPNKFTIEGHNRFYDYWDAKRQGRMAPTKADIILDDIPSFLPHLFIYEVLKDPLDFKLVVMGDMLITMMKMDGRGKKLGKVIEGRPNSEGIRRLFVQVVETCDYSYGIQSDIWSENEFYDCYRLLLPLSDDGKTVDHIIGCAFFPLRRARNDPDHLPSD